MTEPSQVLVVDDEPSIIELLEIVLPKEGYIVLSSQNGEKALEIVRSQPVDCVIQDLKMPGMDGITLLGNIKNEFPQTPVIIMTAFSSWDTAVEAMRLGAYDYIKKPFDNDAIRAVVARALEQKRILDHLPHFVAVNYKAMMDAPSDEMRVQACVVTFECCVRLLTIILVSQYLIRDREDISHPFLNKLINDRFPLGDLSSWRDVLLTALRI